MEPRYRDRKLQARRRANALGQPGTSSLCVGASALSPRTWI